MPLSTVIARVFQYGHLCIKFIVMITRILVPTDFSDGANNALRYALGIAQQAKAEIHLLHTGYIPVPDAYFTAVAYDEIIESIEVNAKAGFEKLKTPQKNSQVNFNT